MDLKNRLVLITGASGGIGAAASEEFARKGAKVILIARNGDKLNDIADGIKASGGEAVSYVCDVSFPKQVASLAKRILKQQGVPDVLFNNAGSGNWKFIQDTDDSEALEMMKTPYLAAFSVTKAFLPSMLERGNGYILNMTSLAAFTPFSGATAYTAARFAMKGFHEALTADLFFTGLKTGLCYFGRVDSPYWKNNPGSEERLPGAQVLIPVLTTEQAARAIVRGVQREKQYIHAPFMASVIEFLMWSFPFITKRLLYYTGVRQER